MLAYKYERGVTMGGNELINNMVDELGRARELCSAIINDKEVSKDEVEELIEDIRLDLDRYYDYADSIDELLKDLEIK